MFVTNKIIKNKNLNYLKKKMWIKYIYVYIWGDIVMFLPNKIIIKKIELSAKNVGLAHGFKTMCKAS